jgi:hypothetical protein
MSYQRRRVRSVDRRDVVNADGLKLPGLSLLIFLARWLVGSLARWQKRKNVAQNNSSLSFCDTKWTIMLLLTNCVQHSTVGYSQCSQYG